MPCEDCNKEQKQHDETYRILEKIVVIKKDLEWGRLMLAIEGMDELKHIVNRIHNERQGRLNG
jgi:hypothetical protein